MLKRVGIVGGVTVLHYWRFTPGLEKGYFSPHFHVLGLGWIDYTKIKSNYEKTNYVIKKISNCESEQDVFSIMRYLLSHSAVKESKHSVQYFGESSNNNMRVEDILEKSVSSRAKLDKIFSKYDASKVTRIETQYFGPDSSVPGIKSYSGGYIRTYNSIVDAVRYTRDELLDYPAFPQSKHNEDEDESNETPVYHAFPQSKHNEDEDESNETPVYHGDQGHDLLYPVFHPGEEQPDPQIVKEPKAYLVCKISLQSSTSSIERSKRRRYVYLIICIDPSTDNICPVCSAVLRRLIPSAQLNPEIWEKYLEDIPVSTVVLIEEESMIADWDYVDHFDVNPEGIFYIHSETAKFSYDAKIPVRSLWYDDLTMEEKMQFGFDKQLAEKNQQHIINHGNRLPRDQKDELYNDYIDLVYTRIVREAGGYLRENIMDMKVTGWLENGKVSE